ncbi:MAG: hypothetical protein ACFFA6_14550 [Promethearchaeota archaeon]
MNQINWTQVAVFGLVALLVFLVGSGCLVLLLAGTAGGGMMMGGYGYGGGQGLCPWCGQPTGGYGPSYSPGSGPGSGGMMPGMGGYGYNPFGFLWPIFSLLVMGAVIGIPILLVLLLVGLLTWLVRGAWRSSPASGEEE